uniref:Chromo domain-containing protein n=1 Tax=Kalanchoe fedtschenkoi TaxID=63787 RepID=A0A7N0U5D9_KALFE
MRTMGSVGEGGSDQGQGLKLNATVCNGAVTEENNLASNVVGKKADGCGLAVFLGGNAEMKGKEVLEGGGGGEGGVEEGGGGEGEDEKLGQGGDEEEEDLPEEEGEGEEAEAVADAGRPKLAEGFYEIEAVRRKRVRKGVLQYLIKWRDWPETANTWEPLENLQSCSDVIEAFEERMRSGRGSQRRRKRKSGVFHAQIRRKPRFSGTYNIRSGRVRNVAESPVTSVPTDDNSFAENPSSSEYNISGVDTKQSSENDVAVNSEVQLSQDKDSDLNMKLTEFRGGVSTDDVQADNLVIPSQVDNGSQPQECAIVNKTETTPSNYPITGSRRRKSGKVRRFIPEPDSGNKPDDASDPVPGVVGALVPENSNLPSFPATSHKITEIIKPLSYAPPESNAVHDVVVTFLAMRSDGKEVLVDNKFMKAYYPLLLINFYEQNLRYNPIS